MAGLKAGAVGPGGIEKVKFTVSVRGHQWSSARHVHETLQEFARVIQVSSFLSCCCGCCYRLLVPDSELLLQPGFLVCLFWFLPPLCCWKLACDFFWKGRRRFCKSNQMRAKSDLHLDDTITYAESLRRVELHRLRRNVICSCLAYCEALCTVIADAKGTVKHDALRQICWNWIVSTSAY